MRIAPRSSNDRLQRPARSERDATYTSPARPEAARATPVQTGLGAGIPPSGAARGRHSATRPGGVAALCLRSPANRVARHGARGAAGARSTRSLRGNRPQLEPSGKGEGGGPDRRTGGLPPSRVLLRTWLRRTRSRRWRVSRFMAGPGAVQRGSWLAARWWLACRQFTGREDVEDQLQVSPPRAMVDHLWCHVRHLQVAHVDVVHEHRTIERVG
jgi:hypothetical protein